MENNSSDQSQAQKSDSLQAQTIRNQTANSTDKFLNFTKEILSLNHEPFMKYSFYHKNYIYPDKEKILSSLKFNSQELQFFELKMRRFGNINPKYRTKKAFLVYLIISFAFILTSVNFIIFSIIVPVAWILLSLAILGCVISIFGMVNEKNIRNNFFVLRREKLLEFINQTNLSIRNTGLSFQISKYTSYVELKGKKQFFGFQNFLKKKKKIENWKIW